MNAINRIPNLFRRVQRTLFPTPIDKVLAIPGWTSRAQITYLMSKVVSLPDPCFIVEIGAWQGRSSLAMAEACRNTGKRVLAVDPWDDYIQRGQAVSQRLGEWNVNSFDENYSAFCENSRRLGLEAWTTPIRKTSAEAAKDWSYNPTDMVFIDGNHDYEAVMADLTAWTAIVEMGGLICGDDWNWQEVKAAVQDFTSRYPDYRLELPCENTWAFVKR
jgi:predicted O-methyltransferase YrrM